MIHVGDMLYVLVREGSNVAPEKQPMVLVTVRIVVVVVVCLRADMCFPACVKCTF